jgi:asparagine synthase (glutamine-hydrolysing)
VNLSRAHDEPFADAANIPLFLMARQLGGRIKVVLAGDGGDEMFAGYRRYSILWYHLFWRLWPKAIRRLVRSAPSDRARRLSRVMDAAGADDPAIRMALLLTTETLADPPISLLREDVQESLRRSTDPFLAYRSCALRFSDTDPVQQMLLTDMHLQLPSQFLSKVDRATMACGIEVRVPLLDEVVARLAITLPTEWKVRGRERKIMLRNAMRGRVPGDILDGPKTGFSVPYQFWLRSKLHDFARAAILEPRFIDRFGFERRKLERILFEHREERRNHGFRLWKVLQLALWSNNTD